MARGKQLDNETVYKIMASYFTTNNYTETARQLDIPIRTVADIVVRNQDKPEFAQLRKEKQKKFGDKFEHIINKALDRLSKEIDEQDKIPVSQLSTVVGTLFDKNRLEQGQSTENTNNTITIGFSDEMQELSK